MLDKTDPTAGVENGRFVDVSRRNVLKATGAGATLPLLSGTGAAVGNEHDEGEEEDGDGEENGDFEELRLVGEAAVENASILDVQGNYTYVSSWSGFSVIDSHDPARPERIAETDVPGVGVHENYLRVDCDLLAVVSQGNGLAPLLGIEEDELEEVDQNELGVQFYDVSDPTAPEHLGTWREPPAGVHNLDLKGDFAYVCRAFPTGDSALRILDVSDPTDPTEVAEWRVEDDHPELDQPVNFLHGVDVRGDRAYLAYWDAGCRILDVGDPCNPVEISAFGEAPDATEPVEGEFPETVFEEPESEFTQRFMGLPGNAHQALPSTDGDHVFFSEETFVGEPGGIRVFDVTDLDDPEEVTRIDPPSDDIEDFAHFFDVTSDRLHSSWEDGGVRVFDISDPEQPQEVSRYDPEGFHTENAEARLSFTVATFTGAGVVFLHPDLGEHGPPTIGDHEDDEHHEEP